MAQQTAELKISIKDAFSGIMKQATESVSGFDNSVEKSNATTISFLKNIDDFKRFGNVAFAFNNITAAAQKLYSPIKEVMDLTAKFNDNFNQTRLSCE